MIYRLLLIISVASTFACRPTPRQAVQPHELDSSTARRLDVVIEKKAPFVFTETIVIGDDTGMIEIISRRRMRIEDVICQRWELVDVSNVRDLEEQESSDLTRQFEELCIFRDKQFVEDPRDFRRRGTWKVRINGSALLLDLVYTGGKTKQFVIRSVGDKNLELMQKQESGLYIRLNLEADALMHVNPASDPFHPSNNKWRIRPASRETDAAIKERVKQCIKFFALFYRDNIKRNQDEISFRNLPKIFKWYSGGIGVYERIEMDETWVDCFYNKEQAMKGYEIVRRLITEKKYDWHTEAPNWILQTHSVLEQMYAEL